jgi:hypothetical protein
MVQLFDSALRYRKRKDDRMVIDDNGKKPIIVIQVGDGIDNEILSQMMQDERLNGYDLVIVDGLDDDEMVGRGWPRELQKFGYDLELLQTYKDPDKTFCPKCGFEANLLSNKHKTWYDCKHCKKAKRTEQRHIAKF